MYSVVRDIILYIISYYYFRREAFLTFMIVTFGSIDSLVYISVSHGELDVCFLSDNIFRRTNVAIDYNS